MLRSMYTESSDQDLGGLTTLAYHDGGFSQFAISHSVVADQGHASVKTASPANDVIVDPADKRFAAVVNRFDSAMDYAEITTRCTTITAPYNRNRLSVVLKMDDYGGRAWYGGFEKITDGFDMISNGWEEGATKASINLKDTKVPDIDGIESIRRNLIFADSGETLNIDQAMAGNWDKAWQTCRRIRSGISRVLPIAIPFGGNCNKSSEQLFWNGAQGMIITDILEDKGYRVQLYGMHFSRHSTTGSVVTELDIVNLKRSDEPLRMDSIAAIVAHAGVFRTAGFCSVVSKPTQIDSGLGRCMEERFPDGVKIGVNLGLLPPSTIPLTAAYDRDAAIESIVGFFERMKGGTSDGQYR